MAGEIIRDYSSWKTLEASGASIANNAFAQADDASFSLSADGGDRPHVELEIEFAFATAPIAGRPLAIHAQDLDLFGGEDDMRAPSANNVAGYIAQVPVENTTIAQRKRILVFNAPSNFALWVQNVETGQTVSSGWKLRARAFSHKQAA